MELAIVPDPSDEERVAIEVALRRLAAPRALPPAYTSAWRRAALGESVELQDVRAVRWTTHASGV